jgi:hypothetical protein
MYIGKFILIETGDEGSVSKLGVSRDFLNSLTPSQDGEILIPKASRNFLLKFFNSYNTYNTHHTHQTIDNLFSQIHIPDYDEDILYRSLEALSKNPEVSKYMSPKKLDKQMSIEDVQQFLREHYFKIVGTDMLSMAISNIPRMIARFETLNFTDKVKNPPLWATKDPDRDLKADLFPVYNPRLRKKYQSSPDDLIDAKFDGNSIEATFHKELYPRNVELIKTRNWHTPYSRKLGEEFNQVSIFFKKEIPQKVLDYINEYVVQFGSYIGVSHGWEKEKDDFLLEHTWSSDLGGKFYTGLRPIFKFNKDNKKELIVYYAPYGMKKNTNNEQQLFYVPFPSQLDLIHKMQNKWLYNRPN